MQLRDLAVMTAICLVWAVNTLVGKIVVTDYGIPPLLYATLRSVLIAVVACPWLLPMPRPRLRLLAATFLIGGCSFGINFVGLENATASSAGIVQQIQLPITTILSVVVLGERIGWRRGLGIALTLVGTLIVMWDPHGFSPSHGLLFIALSAAAASVGAILMKQIHGVRPLQFQAWAGVDAIIPLGLGSALLEHDQWARAAAAGWGFVACVAFSALVVSVVAHTVYYSLIRRYDANLIAPLLLLTPIFTLLLGVELRGDPLDARMAVGAAVTLVGVLIIALRRNRVMPRALIIRDPF